MNHLFRSILTNPNNCIEAKTSPFSVQRTDAIRPKFPYKRSFCLSRGTSTHLVSEESLCFLLSSEIFLSQLPAYPRMQMALLYIPRRSSNQSLAKISRPEAITCFNVMSQNSRQLTRRVKEKGLKPKGLSKLKKKELIEVIEKS